MNIKKQPLNCDGSFFIFEVDCYDRSVYILLLVTVHWYTDLSQLLPLAEH
jgi:hypothetical protein